MSWQPVRWKTNDEPIVSWDTDLMNDGWDRVLDYLKPWTDSVLNEWTQEETPKDVTEWRNDI